MAALGSLDELRQRNRQPRLVVSGHGLSESLLGQLRLLPNVANASAQDGTLVIDLREEGETASLVSLMVANGMQVEEVRKEKASLEDLFLKLMEEEK
jgi:ABC-2 type transport system ATP-binding protein